MMEEDEAAYLYRRAETELEMARQAEHPAAVKAHYLIASHYLDSLYDPADAKSPRPAKA